MSFLPARTTYVLNVQGGQKRISNATELELQMAVRYPVGAGNQTQIVYKSITCSKLTSHFSSPGYGNVLGADYYRKRQRKYKGYSYSGIWGVENGNMEIHCVEIHFSACTLIFNGEI